MKKGIILNLLIAAGLLFLCGLGGLHLYEMRQSRKAAASAIQGEELPWQVCKSRKHLDGTFITGQPLSSGTFGLRLIGQTDVIEVAWDGVKARMGRVLDGRSIYEQEAPLPSSKGLLRLVKAPGELLVCQDGIQLLRRPIRPQEWRRLDWLSLDKAPLPEVSYQKLGNLYFADNFMHGEGEMGEWKARSGEWSVHALKTPVRSANPFSFLGKGKNAEATVGFWFWRNYSLSCAVQPLDNGDFGLKINCCEGGAYELWWNHSSQMLSLGGAVKAAEVSAPLAAKKWYKLRLESIAGRVTASIDGSTVLSATAPTPLLGGSIALCANGGGAIFDDVVVEPTSLASGPDSLDAVVASDGILTVQLSSLQADKPLLLGIREAGNESVQLRLESANGKANAILDYVSGGIHRNLGKAAIQLPGAPATFGLKAIGRELSVLQDGRTLLLCKCRHSWRGGVSVSQPLESVRFQALSPAPGIASRVEMFSHERSMQGWNSPVLEWAASGKDTGADYWHRSDFWNDVLLEMNTTLPRKGGGDFGLVLGSQNAVGDPIVPIATLAYRKASSQLEFTCGPLAKNLKIPNPETCRTLGLERIGDRILARVNGEMAWNAPVPQTPSDLILAGRIGKGNSNEWADAVTIRAEAVNLDLFDQAPADWLPVSGEWELTNRWQCDPRWSFFSGANMSGTACLWSKAQLPADMTIEFFAGPKMYYVEKKTFERAIDFNLSFAADGQSLESGYSAMFGGRDGMGPHIKRKAVVLAENKGFKIRRTEKEGIHHTWYHIKVRRHKGEIAYWIDDKLAVTAMDKEPLTGSRFALWTLNNGVMLAQLRCSAPQITRQFQPNN